MYSVAVVELMLVLCLILLSVNNCHDIVINPLENDFYNNRSYRNCLTLHQFASNTNNYIRSHTNLIFQTGNFTLGLNLTISNAEYFAMYHNSSSGDALILCNQNVNLQFKQIQNLQIRNLHIKGCFDNKIIQVNRFILKNIRFSGTTLFVNGSALVFLQSEGVLIHCYFTKFYFGTHHSSLSFKRDSFKDICMERTTSWIGGAMIVYQSNVTIIQSNFIMNRAQLGGAIYAEKGSTIEIKTTRFISNTVAPLLELVNVDPLGVASGGAIYAVNNCSISIKNSYFDENQAYYGYKYGDVIAMYQGSLNIIESEFTSSFDSRVVYLLECSALLELNEVNHSHGGVVYAMRSSVIFLNNNISDSRASQGGVVYMINSSVAMQYSIFEHNFAQSDAERGGVIYSMDESSISMKSCIFRSNSAWYGGVIYYEGLYLDLSISDCNFLYNSAESQGGVLYLTKPYRFSKAQENVKLIIVNSKFQGNRVKFQGGVIFSVQITHLTILDSKNMFIENSGSEGAVMYVESVSGTIESSNSCISHNNAIKQGAVVVKGPKITYSGIIFNGNKGSALIIIEADVIFQRKSSFIGNKAHNIESDINGGALSSIRSIIKFNAACELSENEAHLFGGAIVSFNSHIHVLNEISISRNKALLGGGIYLYQSELLCKREITIIKNFANSSGGGIYSSMSFIRLSDRGSLIYKENYAQFGGGIFFTRNSRINIQGRPGQEGKRTLRLLLVYNEASKDGGGIFIEDETNSFSCSPPLLDDHVYLKDECFIQAIVRPFYWRAGLEYLHFNKNKARCSGPDIYGGLMDRCRPNPLSSEKPLNFIEHLLNISNIKNLSISVSSRPVRVCFCEDNKQDCNYQPGPVDVMKGEDFTLQLVAVDQVNNSVNASIYAYTLSESSGLGVGQRSQYGLKNCTNVTYRIYSEYPSEDLILYAEGPCKNANLSVRSVSVHFLPCKCPIGFMVSPSSQSECKCICHELLDPYLMVCNYSTALVVRNTPVWIDYIHRNASQSIVEGYIIFPHCPYDYCFPSSTLVYLNLSNEGGADAQCAFNHSGLLCGACKPGFSLALGTSSCLQCSNTWLLLLIPFCLAGIILVTSILILDLTVSKGTTNAMVFFSNIVIANRPIFIPLTRYNFLAMFISWLSLDLGIETCFAVELDQYKKTWLQFIFPLYIFMLVVIVIIAAQCSQKFSKLLGGRNPIATLATLIWLSNAKLFRTVLSAVSFATLKYPDNTSTLVWLPDGNVEFLKGKHIPLFLTAITVFIASVVYIAILFLWQCLICVPKCKITSWITNTRLISLMDAYQAPYKGKHRYWPGLMLLTCIVQYSVAALNTQGDPIINLFAIIVLVVTINMYKGSVSGVYRKWPLDILETSVHFNLILFSAATMYVIYTGGNQPLLTNVSLSIYFITFNIIIGYHVLLALCGKKLNKFNSKSRQYCNHNNSLETFRDPESLQLFDSTDHGLDKKNAEYHEIMDKVIKPRTFAITYSEVEITKDNQHLEPHT